MTQWHCALWHQQGHVLQSQGVHGLQWGLEGSLVKPLTCCLEHVRVFDSKAVSCRAVCSKCHARTRWTGWAIWLCSKKALHYLNCVLRSTFMGTKLESLVGWTGSRRSRLKLSPEEDHALTVSIIQAIIKASILAEVERQGLCSWKNTEMYVDQGTRWLEKCLTWLPSNL